jgi:hypothetical protein
MKLTYEPEKKISDESCISKHAASMKAEGPWMFDEWYVQVSAICSKFSSTTE